MTAAVAGYYFFRQTAFQAEYRQKMADRDATIASLQKENAALKEDLAAIKPLLEKIEEKAGKVTYIIKGQKKEEQNVYQTSQSLDAARVESDLRAAANRLILEQADALSGHQ